MTGFLTSALEGRSGRNPRASRLALPVTWIAATAFVLLTAFTAAAPLVKLAEGPAVAHEPPALAWQETTPRMADNGYAYDVQLSIDGFQTVLYSTHNALGTGLADDTWQVPDLLWDYLPTGAELSWRVRVVDPSGHEVGISDHTALRVQAHTPPGETVTVSFSKLDKLAAVDAGTIALDREYVIIAPGTASGGVMDSLSETGFPVEYVPMPGGLHAYRMQTAVDGNPAAAVEQARAILAEDRALLQSGMDLGDGVIIQPNFVYATQLVPTDPFYAGTPKYQYAPQMIHADKAWAAGITGEGIVVAVADTGLNLGGSTHQEFNSADKIVAPVDFVNLDVNTADGNNHGTNVAGIIVAEADGVGMVGIAPGARLMPIKVLADNGFGSSLDVALGILHATHSGAHIVNLSLGANVFGALPGVLSGDILREAVIREANARGVVVVAAAGNDGTSLPATPAQFGDTIYVGAVNPEGVLTEFSNHGPWLSLVAPGVDMFSADRSGTNQYSYQSGTSQATPVVAGAAALLLSAHPALTPRQVKEILEASATDLGPPGRDPFYGAGLVNIAAALGLPDTPDTLPPAVARVEMGSDRVLVTFNQDMLADGSANAVNNPSNWVASAGTQAIVFTAAGRSISYNQAARQLLIINSTQTQTGVQAFGVASNVRSASGRNVFNNFINPSPVFSATLAQNAVGASLPGTFADQVYASAVATADRRVQALFRHPVVPATAQNPANYTLRRNPTSSAGTGGTVQSLAGASLNYDAASRILTMSNLPAGMGNDGDTFSLALGSGIQNADLGNPIASGNINPALGLVLENPAEPLRLVSVDNIDPFFGDRFWEVLFLEFNRPLATTDAVFDPASYSVSFNGGPNAVPAYADTLYAGGRNYVVLTGINMWGRTGQSVTATVQGISDVYGNQITPPDNTVTLPSLVSGTNFGPELDTAVANGNSLQVRFRYYIKMRESDVVNASSWVLRSDASASPSTIVPLGGATITYDETANSALFEGLNLTPGHRFTISVAANSGPGSIRQRFSPPGFTIDSGFGTASLTGVVGSGTEDSPPAPVGLTVLGSNSPGNDGEIDSVNESNASVRVDLAPGVSAGDEVFVSIADSSVPPLVVTGSGTLASGGAQAFTVSGIDATALAVGDLAVTARVYDSGGIGFSDTIAAVATRTASTPPPPEVLSVTRLGGAAPLTNAATISFEVTFSEPVDNFTAGNISISATGGQGAASVSLVSTLSRANGTVFRVDVDTVDNNEGEVGIRIDQDLGSITSSGSGLSPDTPFTGGETYTVDRLAPDTTADTGLSNGTLTPDLDGNIQIPFTINDAQSVQVFFRKTGTKRLLPGFSQYPGSFAASPATLSTAVLGGAGIYEFYTIGTDAAGNIEGDPPGPQITNLTINGAASVQGWDEF